MAGSDHLRPIAAAPAASADLTQRLQAADLAARGVQRALDHLLFEDHARAVDAYELRRMSLVTDWATAQLRRPGSGEALARLKSRAIVNTTTGDVPGLLPFKALPSWVLDTIARRQRTSLSFLETIATAGVLPEHALPWVPTLRPPVPAGVQTAEKTAVSSRAIVVEGGIQTPTTIGEAGNVSWQAMSAAADTITALVAEDVIAGAVAWIVAQLSTVAGAAVATLATALAAVENAGWIPDLIVGPASTWGTLVPDPAAERYAGIPTVLGVPTGGPLYVIALAGVWCALSGEDRLTVTEPSIGGFEVGVLKGVVFSAGAGCVAAVDTTAPAAARR